MSPSRTIGSLTIALLLIGVAVAPAQDQFSVLMIKNDGTQCFGPGSYSDDGKSMNETCAVPWVRLKRGFDSDLEPRFGWYCKPRQRLCRVVLDGQGCMCQRLDALSRGWMYVQPNRQNWLGLAIADESRCSPYNRDDYDYPQAVERDIALRQGMVSLYTGREFDSLQESDIEHVVALSEAHDSGMCAADVEDRVRFASDLDNLTLAAPDLNRYEKRAKDTAEWLPQQNQCWFARVVVWVKRKYDLTVDQKEYDALTNLLIRCQDNSAE